jgi:hypothetical protein
MNSYGELGYASSRRRERGERGMENSIFLAQPTQKEG